MDVNKKERQILRVLARSVRAAVEDADLDFGQVQEIRMRTEKPLIVVYKNEERIRGRGTYRDQGGNEGNPGVCQPLFPLCL